MITDLLMPVMDGRELCREIKQDEITAHIPVIMLTALKSEAHELEALEVGADEYLVKPVRTKVLLQRLENLTKSRIKLREQFVRTLLDTPKEGPGIDVESPNERFIKKLRQVVYANIDDPSFTVDQFASEMFVSRMTLHRKMKAITGMAPAAFVRKTRLKEAAELLKTGEFQVSDVLHRVGFEDLSHFGLVFKKHFRMTPTQFIEQARAGRKKS